MCSNKYLCNANRFVEEIVLTYLYSINISLTMNANEKNNNNTKMKKKIMIFSCLRAKWKKII